MPYVRLALAVTGVAASVLLGLGVGMVGGLAVAGMAGGFAIGAGVLGAKLVLDGAVWEVRQFY